MGCGARARCGPAPRLLRDFGHVQEGRERTPLPHSNPFRVLEETVANDVVKPEVNVPGVRSVHFLS